MLWSSEQAIGLGREKACLLAVVGCWRWEEVDIVSDCGWSWLRCPVCSRREATAFVRSVHISPVPVVRVDSLLHLHILEHRY